MSDDLFGVLVIKECPVEIVFPTVAGNSTTTQNNKGCAYPIQVIPLSLILNVDNMTLGKLNISGVTFDHNTLKKLSAPFPS